jgi:hypothetical protein
MTLITSIKIEFNLGSYKKLIFFIFKNLHSSIITMIYYLLQLELLTLQTHYTFEKNKINKLLKFYFNKMFALFSKNNP